MAFGPSWFRCGFAKTLLNEGNSGFGQVDESGYINLKVKATTQLIGKITIFSMFKPRGGIK